MKDNEMLKTGYWIPIPNQIEYDSDAKCSECGEEVAGGLDYKFCPHCGRLMAGRKIGKENLTTYQLYLILLGFFKNESSENAYLQTLLLELYKRAGGKL